MSNRKSILLTGPEGGTVDILNENETHSKDAANTKNSPIMELSNSAGDYFSAGANNESSGVKFDSEQIENDRGRTRSRNNREDSSGTGNSFSYSSNNNSKSRSRSRASSMVRDEEFLKWTVLRKDPSMRLKFRRANDGAHRDHSNEDLEDDDDEYFDEDDDEISDEEQVSDLENELEIDDFTFDLGMKVLPNYCISINEVLERSKPWKSAYNEDLVKNKIDPNANVLINELEGGFVKAMELISKNNKYDDDIDSGSGSFSSNSELNKQDSEHHASTSATIASSNTNNTTSSSGSSDSGDSFILYTDLSSESTYALTYVMGTLVKNNDTLYIVHWEGSTTSNNDAMKKKMTSNLQKIRENVMYLNDCNNSIIDRLDVVVISMTHPYPKHFLNEMIYGLKPKSLICSLNIMLSPSGLQNYVCSIPVLVIRKKLKRTRRRGIDE
ncbi:hypothetical protein TPHA_0E00160 [Tetrapisispora phaffii CBS 4417]|uniref:UspA domain-containing protein n=1 Tax=Tetrapisispora phaffii (strain ATCC 24235 / CBS 4417 / NBRC 1672 / NRRL Y-8282 / UCD 70-5) TaxID=1071381 RepID=G8BT85_TETPH|nr:hypothetical protein TPHA_0E00160 [Tetrapisispora phaffii CBS 4417]CCE63113.1 hypothetical protein TPHA_0E00160 [Tetrapisispora phaffii CBS 4417]